MPNCKCGHDVKIHKHFNRSTFCADKITNRFGEAKDCPCKRYRRPLKDLIFPWRWRPLGSY